jgi:ubiquinone/menaquinone biosynthesis C-methylase UbiE
MANERQEHNENSPWWGEHLHRYNLVIPYLSSALKTLDIASGNGFGSYLLSKNTKGTVVGGDISMDAVNYCSERFSSQTNLEFKQIDGTKIEFADEHFDLLVSFETIEHTTQYKEMLREFYRILKKGGTGIISTPNIIINSPNGIEDNPFHTQEFTLDELAVLLDEIFDEVTIYGQKYSRYNKDSLRNRIGKFTEKMLYLRGIRKIPIRIQNMLMQFLIKKNMYPLAEDFTLVNDKKEILNCKTFFAICKKK